MRVVLAAVGRGGSAWQINWSVRDKERRFKLAGQLLRGRALAQPSPGNKMAAMRQFVIVALCARPPVLVRAQSRSGCVRGAQPARAKPAAQQ